MIDPLDLPSLQTIGIPRGCLTTLPLLHLLSTSLYPYFRLFIVLRFFSSLHHHSPLLIIARTFPPPRLLIPVLTPYLPRLLVLVSRLLALLSSCALLYIHAPRSSFSDSDLQ